jgi:Arc/MetJ family transcription regulator
VLDDETLTRCQRIADALTAKRTAVANMSSDMNFSCVYRFRD